VTDGERGELEEVLAHTWVHPGLKRAFLMVFLGRAWREWKRARRHAHAWRRLAARLNTQRRRRARKLRKG